LISAVVIWEIAIKRRLGKLDAPADLLVRLEGADVDLLPITPATPTGSGRCRYTIKTPSTASLSPRPRPTA
jgi:PIN domain nuclease of toxin-antitoxin system